MTTLVSQDEAAEILSRYLKEVKKDKMTEEPKAKRIKLVYEENHNTEEDPQFHKTPEERKTSASSSDSALAQSRRSIGSNNNVFMRSRIETGIFRKVPPQLFLTRILKFLSSEDLISCSLVCRFLNYAASHDSLWRRLYCMRWRRLPPSRKLLQCSWKKLYLQHDEKDILKLVENCPPQFKQYYIQMEAVKRSQVPLPSKVNDDGIVLDKTVAEQVSMWKSTGRLTDKVVADHVCSGETCTYYQIRDVFVCEKTGHVHVCDDNCRQAVTGSTNELSVCRISGRCFDSLLSLEEMEPCCTMEQYIHKCPDTDTEDKPYIYISYSSDEEQPLVDSGCVAQPYLRRRT